MNAIGTISLTKFEAKHLQRSREWFNDPELARLLDRSRQISQEEHEKWFAELQRRSDCAYFAVEDPHRNHIGNVWLHDIDRKNGKAELRVVLGESGSVGRGCGTEAIKALVHHAFTDLGLQRVYAFVLETNPRAKKAFEKAGFSVEGLLRRDRMVHGKLTDTYLLATFSTDAPNAPLPEV